MQLSWPKPILARYGGGLLIAHLPGTYRRSENPLSVDSSLNVLVVGNYDVQEWHNDDRVVRTRERGVGKFRCLPRALVVEEPVRSLLIVFSDRLWLLMTLKPCLVLLVESPTLRLKCLCRKILLVCTLTVVEGIE